MDVFASLGKSSHSNNMFAYAQLSLHMLQLYASRNNL